MFDEHKGLVLEEPSYETLVQKQKELKKQMYEMSAYLQGDDHPAVAEEVQQLMVKESILLAKKEKYEKEIEQVNQQIELIQDEKAKLQQKKEQMLLQDMQKKRWYFFQNKPLVMFDRNSGLLWPNLHVYALNSVPIEEARESARTIQWHGIHGWEVPTYEQLKELVENRQYPFQSGKHWRIQDTSDFLIHNGRINLDILQPVNGLNAHLLPVNECYYTRVFHPSDNTYVGKWEKERHLLAFFIRNEWDPEFDDKELNEIFARVKERELLLKQYKENESLLHESGLYRRSFTEPIVLQDVLADFDMKAINSSTIQYIQAAKRLLSQLLYKVNDLSSHHARLLSWLGQVSNRLCAGRGVKEIEERRALLCAYVTVSEKQVQEELAKFLEDVRMLERKLRSAGEHPDRFAALYELEHEKRPSFLFLAEYTIELVNRTIKKVNWLNEHEGQVKKFMDVHVSWEEDYSTFVTHIRKLFFSTCEEEAIDAVLYTEWFQEWDGERRKLEGQLLTLIEHGLEHAMAEDVTDGLLEEMVQYRQHVQQFYEEERLAIHQKYAFEIAGELKERLEKENALAKLAETFGDRVAELIVKQPSLPKKSILADWAQYWLDHRIDSALQFMEEDSFYMQDEIAEKFKKLKQESLSVFLFDIENYTKKRKERMREYHSLMYRMRKDIAGKGSVLA